MGGREQDFIKEAFDTNWVVPLGPNVAAFEAALSAYLGEGRHTVALSAGTAAVHLALVQLGVGPGDEVVCQSFTFAASANPVVYCGGVPVFVDSEEDTWNMDPALLEKALLDRREKTGKLPKAIIPVHLYGMPAKMDEICAVAAKFGVPVLEDAAEALGSSFRGRKCGTFGEFGSLSFNGNKIITTSGGGMLMCNDEATRKKVLFWATQSREPFPWYQHEEIGYNYRMSNICAGIGRGQLKVLDERVNRKREINALYRKAFADNPYIDVIPTFEGAESSYWLTGATLTKDCKASFMDIIDALNAENIESRPAWKPMHMQPVFADCGFVTHLTDEQRKKSGFGSVCEDLFSRSLCLPSDTKMTDEDVLFVASVVNKTVYDKQK